jgi:hypothetical protein
MADSRFGRSNPPLAFDIDADEVSFKDNHVLHIVLKDDAGNNQ